MISSLINDGGILTPGSGTILQPGVEWSVNTIVGYRENSANIAKYSWKKAGGLENGGISPQYGGGVCQLGSTTFNAIIRAGSAFTIVKQKHHSIPSDYIPLGLDATLSSNTNLDLIVRNDGTMPYYLVSYINPKDKNVTVEIYGPPAVEKDHPEWGNVIYDYTSDFISNYGDPVSATKYCNGVPLTAPDGTIIDGVAYTEYQYAPNRQGTKVKTYKHIYDLNGNPLWEGEFQPMYSYPVINGTIYIWGYEEGMEPSPTPEPTISSGG